MARKPAIRDTARLAGVLKLTVSRVLNDRINGDCITRVCVQKDLSSLIDRALATNLIAGLLASVPTHLPQHLVTLTSVRQPFHEIVQCATEMWLSLLNPRHVPACHWRKLALPPDPEARTRTSGYNWPSCRVQFPLTLSARASRGFGHQSPSQNTW